MKFEVQKHTRKGIECIERLGKLTRDKHEITTPTCTLFLSAGCVPFVTNDLLKHVKNIPKIIEVSLSTL